MSLKAQKKIKIPQIKPDFVLFDKVDFYDNRREPYEIYDGEMVPEGDGTYKIPKIKITLGLLYSDKLGIHPEVIYPIIDTIWVYEPLKDSIYSGSYLLKEFDLRFIRKKLIHLIIDDGKLNSYVPEKYKKNKVTLRFRFKNKTYILSTNNINFIVK